MIGLVTYPKYPELTADDRPLIAELDALGLSARPVTWGDPAVHWSEFEALVLRSCWDYHLRPREFAGWLDQVDGEGVPIWNPAPLVRWNMHKGYLRDLASEGVLVPETEWVPARAGVTLSAILDMHGWTEAIVKPAISASATDTWRTSHDLTDDGRRFAELLGQSDILVQRVIPEVATRGEWSLVFIDGAFSHATMKRPRAGDFRVQTEHGGTAEPVSAPDAIVAAGDAVTRHLRGPWLFARIDGVETPEGFMLMEVECIEPHLFFGHAPGSRARFARALARRIRGA